MTRTPAAAKRGACASDCRSRRPRRGRCRGPSGRRVSTSSTMIVAARRTERRSGASATMAKKRSSAIGKSRSSSSRRMTAPTWPVAPTTPTRRARPRGGSGVSHVLSFGIQRDGSMTPRQRPVPAWTTASSSPSRPNAVCTTRAASCEVVGAGHDRDADLGGRDHLDVDARRRTAPRRASPRRRRCVRMPAPTTASLPIWSSCCEALRSRPRPARRQSASAPSAPSAFGRVNEMSVRPVAAAETFCTIMSMFAPVLATILKISAALPGTSGTPTTVILASLRSVGDAGDDRLFHCFSLGLAGVLPGSQHPGALAVVERSNGRGWVTPCRRAYSTARM